MREEEQLQGTAAQRRPRCGRHPATAVGRPPRLSRNVVEWQNSQLRNCQPSRLGCRGPIETLRHSAGIPRQRAHHQPRNSVSLQLLPLLRRQTREADGAQEGIPEESQDASVLGKIWPGPGAHACGTEASAAHEQPSIPWPPNRTSVSVPAHETKEKVHHRKPPVATV